MIPANQALPARPSFRLRDLDRSGPRSLRVLWGAARDELSSRYGDVTIGMLLDAYTKENRSGDSR